MIWTRYDVIWNFTLTIIYSSLRTFYVKLATSKEGWGGGSAYPKLWHGRRSFRTKKKFLGNASFKFNYNFLWSYITFWLTGFLSKIRISFRKCVSLMVWITFSYFSYIRFYFVKKCCILNYLRTICVPSGWELTSFHFNIQINYMHIWWPPTFRYANLPNDSFCATDFYNFFSYNAYLSAKGLHTFCYASLILLRYYTQFLNLFLLLIEHLRDLYLKQRYTPICVSYKKQYVTNKVFHCSKCFHFIPNFFCILFCMGKYFYGFFYTCCPFGCYAEPTEFAYYDNN